MNRRSIVPRHLRAKRLHLESLEPRTLLAADVVISEFMASNGNTLEDGFGNSPDWIELHNQGNADADLSGYSLTDKRDQPQKWIFPADTILPADAYLIVFASGDDTTDPAGYLHTNFSLDADGETLSLIDPNQNVISTYGIGEQAYPPQVTDVSYGREGFGFFPSSDVPVTISSTAKSTVTSQIEVADLPGLITDVNLSLDIQHTWDADLEIFLISPAGTRIELATKVGRSGDNFLSTRFDDQASQSIADGTAPFTGSFRPEGSLADVAGESALGTWTLEITDTFAAEGGSLDRWSLQFETTQTPAAPRIGYLMQPTPGQPNLDARFGVVADTSFSVDRGFYDEPFQVEVTSATPDAVIYFTTDGSEPSPANSNSTVYSGPITIGTTTTLRAAAYKDDFVPTNVDTQTYLFLADVIQQNNQPSGYPSTWDGRQSIAADYEMDRRITTDPQYANQLQAALTSHPTVSLVMDVEDWFDPQTGIYANSEEKGEFWERETSVELFGFEHGEEIQLNAGIRMQGNASRWPSRPKHNMRLAFRGEYGSSKLNFPLFDNTDIQSFNGIVLRGGNGDAWVNNTVGRNAAYIRDQWHRDMQSAMGHETSLQGYAHLYINGLYWGLFHLFERVEADFMAEHFGGQADDYDVIKDIRNTGGRVEAISGTTDAWMELVRRSELDMTVNANYESVLEYLDVENFIDYLLMNFYSGNRDWDQSNWRAGRRREDGSKFVLFSWDAERTDINNLNQNVSTSLNLDVTNKNNTNYPTYIHQKLVRNEEYRLKFADRIQKWMFHDSVLTPTGAAKLWNLRADEIRTAIIAESARWGDAHTSRPFTPADWESHNQIMNEQYFPSRTDVVLQQLVRRNLYPNLAAPELSRLGGTIPANFPLSILAEQNVTIYYSLNGQDPRAIGGNVHDLGGNTQTYTSAISIQPGDRILVRAFRDGQWSALVETSFEPSNMVGDFNQDQQIDSQDIDLICAAMHANDVDPQFDLDQNGTLDQADAAYLLDTILQIPLGDANLDGVFDSSDLVLIFQAGEFEDLVERNSGWADGDWNCDGEFDSGDLVAAFQAGTYGVPR